MSIWKKIFNPQRIPAGIDLDVKSISDAIAEAEEETSAEIRVHYTVCKSRIDIVDDAKKVFNQLGMYNTENRNAVLIYLRLKQKQISIIGDSGIHTHVGDDFWNAVKDEVIETIKSSNLTQGIEKGINILGKQLGKHFPPSEDNPNELSNEVTFG